MFKYLEVLAYGTEYMEANEPAFRIEEYFRFLDPYVAEWFDSNYSSLTDPQKEAIPLIHAGKNVLVSSPTGTGKTLTAFLSIINELFILARNEQLEDRIYCVYISPLKALANDIDKNLKKPLEGIYEIAEKNGDKIKKIKVSVRSGDTSLSERQKMSRKPPHILITTPESLSLALSSPKFRDNLKSVRYVIVDEIHEISSTKRGSLLSANLERLSTLSGNPVRIGLSATQSPIQEIAKYLTGFSEDGPRECDIVEINSEKYLDLRTITPVEDLTRVSYEVANDRMYDIIADLVKKYRTTLIFTNTRSGTEHVAMRLKSHGIESLEAHHSSMGKEMRLEVENKLKRGELKCVITSTSLELGIDIGSIDLVIQIGSPKSVSKGLQRIGRSGHGINELSKGVFIVFTLDDLVECAVLTKAAYDRQIDRVDIPLNPLDVLAQVLVGMSIEKAWNIDEAYSLLKKSYTFNTLSFSDFMSTINYLSGNMEDIAIYPKVWYDPDTKSFGKKKSTRMIYFMNVGTIPDEANYRVINENGKNVGELSDKFVERLKAGDVFALGARAYAFQRTSRNRVYVRSATGMKPTVPSWTGELLPRSYDLGVMIGEFRKNIADTIQKGENPYSMLMRDYHIDGNSANSIISYIKAQIGYGIPTEKSCLVEGYIESDKVYGIIFHVPVGRRINDALSRAYAQAISNRYGINIRITVTDDGFILYTEKNLNIQEAIHLINASNFQDYVKRSLVNTEVFKQRFRHCASRSLMILRSYKGYDVSVAHQQLRSDKLLHELEKYPDFSILIETMREITDDMMDVPRALEYVGDVIDAGKVQVRGYSRDTSPFSYGMIMAGSSDIVMMEDRSRMLRELQSKMLSQIYGTDQVSFMFNDQKSVDDYFSRKVPVVSGYDSLIVFSRYFPYMDIMRGRFNSPYAHASSDISEDVARAVSEDKIVSVYMKGVQWTSIDYYPVYYSLFAKERELSGNEKKVYDACDGLSFSEIREKAKLGEEAVKDTLMDLESSYMVRRKIREGMTVYVKNDLKPDPVGRKDSVKKIAGMILSAFGPQTIEELEIKIPLPREEIKEAADSLVSSGEAVYDYITPVYSRQYVIRDDIRSMMSEFNVMEYRLKKLSVKVPDVNGYFDRYGFAFDELNLRSRIGENFRGIPESPVIMKGRYIKAKMTYISEWLADALYSLRYEELSEIEKKVMDIIEKGYGTDKDISAKSGYDKKIARQVIRSLEFKIRISRKDSYIVPTVRKKMEEKEAMALLVKHYGPVSFDELRRFFWIRLNSLDASSKVYYNGNVYYSSETESYSDGGIIVSINDPVAMYLGIYTDSIDYNRIFIYNGKEIMTYSEETRVGTVWIRNINVYEKGYSAKFFEALKPFYYPNEIIIHDPDSGLGTEDYEGFYRSGNVIMSMPAEAVDLNEDGMVAIALSHVPRKAVTPGSTYDAFSSFLFGIRDGIESMYSGISDSVLERYYDSGLLYQFSGPFGENAYATKDVISIYRAIRGTGLDRDEQEIVRFILSTDGISEREITDGLERDIKNLKKKISSLYSKCVIARDSMRKYIYVGEKYTRMEALETLRKYAMKFFGFLTPEGFAQICGITKDESYRFLNTSGLKKYVCMDTEDIYYVEKDIGESRKKITRILTDKDMISLFFSSFIKRKFGTQFNSYYVYKGEPVLAISTRKENHGFSVRKFSGNPEFLPDMKKEFFRAGYSLDIANAVKRE